MLMERGGHSGRQVTHTDGRLRQQESSSARSTLEPWRRSAAGRMMAELTLSGKPRRLRRVLLSSSLLRSSNACASVVLVCVCVCVREREREREPREREREPREREREREPTCSSVLLERERERAYRERKPTCSSV